MRTHLAAAGRICGHASWDPTACASRKPRPSARAVLRRKAVASHADDPWEREADRLADHALSSPAPSRSSAGAPPSGRAPGRTSGAPLAESFDLAGSPAVRATRGPGQPLPAATRAFFEPRLGYDFSNVRVHVGAEAEHAARSVQARAYTFGADLVFGAGEYAPGTSAGRRLIAHELAHVVQQSAAPRGGERSVSSSPRVVQRFVGPPPPGAERAAEELARRTLQGPAARASWRQFWRVVVRRFALRGAVAAALTAADGPFPVGDLIALGLTLWTIWEILELWDLLWREAAREASRPTETQTHPEPDPRPRPDQQRPPPPPSRRDERARCQETHPYALPCDEWLADRDTVLADFFVRNDLDPGDMGECRGIESFPPGAIDACDGAPGERWHCGIRGTADEVSIFGCLCCDEDGNTGRNWQGAHKSVNQSRRGR